MYSIADVVEYNLGTKAFIKLQKADKDLAFLKRIFIFGIIS